ncbi:MAG: hypothetical protein V2A74_14645, partial [bacterium]
DDYGVQSFPVPATHAGAAERIADLLLPSRVSWSGKILDDLRRPLANWVLEVQQVPPVSSRQMQRYSSGFDYEGGNASFHLGGLLPGPASVRFTRYPGKESVLEVTYSWDKTIPREREFHEDIVLPMLVPVSVSSLSTGSVTLSLSPIGSDEESPSGRSSTRIPSMRLQIPFEQRERLPSPSGGSPQTVRSTSKIAWLPPGQYEVDVPIETNHERASTITITSAGPNEIVIPEQVFILAPEF